ncbi:MAG: CDP-diacylglycerol--glycerol-3-phosphate 3-phosphatidyltransferase [Elusimicrobiota bacterium]
MNLANKLTFFRILLIIPFACFLLQSSQFFHIAALLVFTAASLTDYLDGWAARKRREVSSLGKFLDPLADKLLIICAFTIFIKLDEISISSWPVILIISREFIINGLRTFAAVNNRIIAASISGKIKTVVQTICVYLILLILITGILTRAANYLAIIAALAAVWSGILYLPANRSLFKENQEAI